MRKYILLLKVVHYLCISSTTVLEILEIEISLEVFKLELTVEYIFCM